MDWNATSLALLTALGVGLMIGVVRERTQPPHLLPAGTRTHALVALLGCITWLLGPWVFIAALLALAALTLAAYLQSAHEDPGLTGEVALLLAAVLGALAAHEAALSGALGVLVAILLQAKAPLQKISREWISEREIQDALLLGAAALVVMPLLPREPIDPWGAIRPMLVWRIVVLVMAVGVFGHFAQRILGARWGLAIAGFFSGFASSTAAVSSLGQQARADAALVVPSAAAALLANLASLLLFVAVVAAVSPSLLQATLWSWVAAVLGLLAAIAALWWLGGVTAPAVQAPQEDRAFRLSHALLIAGLIAGVSLLAAWLEQLFGHTGALAAAAMVALAEVQAAAAGVAQLVAKGGMPLEVGRWGTLAVLGASCVSKGALAFAVGGVRYGVLVALGLWASGAGA
ncbi:MgtC family [Comamonas aquatica]|uniref:MgtC/SapB family protein n=1 Tax=Comamonas aquatica TaxID=225991 RepID=UPI001EF1AC7D|nr:DUF4010 domain-containing protein [Comamonas aquatica]CAB5645008.1 MgtC family [Comamonas aquatica]CAC9188738.1 MgtC family [Comamonas aquatica]